MLWITDGRTEIAATLDVGIRIIHLSHYGMENLFYRQPEDLSDSLFKPGGWKLLGGHRLWFAPESESSYYPDQSPIAYSLEKNAVTLTQDVDPWMNLRKSMRLAFGEDGKIAVRWSVENLGQESIRGALWGINTLRGGIGRIGFQGRTDEPYRPNRTLQLWRDTSLADDRICFLNDDIIVRHKIGGSYFKVGIYSRNGSIHHENLNQTFDITFPVYSMNQCTDGGSNVEVWMGRYCMELEVLGPIVILAPRCKASYEVTWCVNRAEK